MNTETEDRLDVSIKAEMAKTRAQYAIGGLAILAAMLVLLGIIGGIMVYNHGNSQRFEQCVAAGGSWVDDNKCIQIAPR